MLFDGAAHCRAKLLVGYGGTRRADYGHSGWQSTLGGERVQRRNELPLRQVAARAEDDHGARRRHPREAQSLQEWVLLRFLYRRLGEYFCHCLRGYGAGAAAGSSAFTGWPPNSFRSAAITLLPKPSGRRD